MGRTRSSTTATRSQSPRAPEVGAGGHDGRRDRAPAGAHTGRHRRARGAADAGHRCDRRAAGDRAGHRLARWSARSRARPRWCGRSWCCCGPPRDGADRPPASDSPRPAGARRRDRRRRWARWRARSRPIAPLPVRPGWPSTSASAWPPRCCPPSPSTSSSPCPNGLLATPGRRRGVIAMYVTSAVVGVALLADRDRVITWPVDPAVADRLRLRSGRRARPLRDGRRHRPPAHAVGRLGARGGRRGRARRHRAQRADEPSGPPRRVGGRRDRRRAARPDRQHVQQGRRPGRPPRHLHRLAGRADRARRRRVRGRGPRARPHAAGVASARCCCSRWARPRSPR